MMRPGEAIYKELLLATQTDEAALLAAMVEHPILLERPVVSNGQKAVICRPPERVVEVF
jgi:arsenate reductase